MEIISILSAIGYGITMKVADLFNEHGLKWFKNSNILFGVIWGLFGALLVVYGDDVIANMILGMNVAFIFRKRLDFLNHQLAAGIIFFSFILFASFNLWVFLVFGLIFFIFGSVKDYFDDKVITKNSWFWLSEAMLYYPLPALIYSWMYGDWLVFWVFTVYTLVYNTTKYIAAKQGFV